MEQNFHMDQSHIKLQLGNLYTLLQFIGAELANYLGKEKKQILVFNSLSRREESYKHKLSACLLACLIACLCVRTSLIGPITI